MSLYFVTSLDTIIKELLVSLVVETERYVFELNLFITSSYIVFLFVANVP